MDKNELLPCPFCGGEAKQYTDRCVSAESGERFIGSKERKEQKEKKEQKPCV